MKTFYRQNKSFLIIFTVMLAYFIQHAVCLRMGLHFEETRGANAYFLATQDFMPYRDFEWGYGPFAFFIYPLFFKMFGVSLLVLRLAYISFASLVIPLTYFLARRIMPPAWAGVAAFLAVVFFDVPYYTVNHIFAVLGELACLLMLCRFYETGKKVTRFLFWAGASASVTLMTKPLLAGMSLVGCVSLFMLFIERGALRKKIGDYAIFISSSVSLVLPYSLYFYYRTAVLNMPVRHSFFAKDSALFVDLLVRIKTGEIFLRFFQRFMDIFPVKEMLAVCSLSGLKRIFVVSFDNFIFILPFMVAFIVFFLIYKCGRAAADGRAAAGGRAGAGVGQKVRENKRALLLLAAFSVLIAVESLIVTHKLGRAFILQVPFILTAYILYLIKAKFPRRPAVTMSFIVFFLFYLSFLHFFRYPYSMSRRCSEPLNLARAGGIFVSPEEKGLYESLASYLSDNLREKDKIAIACYYPQFSFLTRQRNIFEDEEWLFAKLRDLAEQAGENHNKKPVFTAMEDRIISRIEKEQPRIVLAVTDDIATGFKLPSPRVQGYIEKEYSLDRIFGPADVEGLGYTSRWVEAYIHNLEKGENKK